MSLKADARQPLDVAVLVQRRQRRRQRELVEGVEQQVGSDPGRVVLVGRPVEAGHALELVDAGAADEDVVAAFADELVGAAVAEEDVVAEDRVLGEDLVEVVAGRAVERALLDPVVALVAEDALGRPGAEDEVVAGSAEDFGTAVGAGDDEVVAGAAERPG